MYCQFLKRFSQLELIRRAPSVFNPFFFWLSSSRCWASSLSFLYPSTIIQSSIICLGLPVDLFPNMFPSITVFNSDSPLRVCLIHFFCLDFIVHMRDLSSPLVSNTFSCLTPRETNKN